MYHLKINQAFKKFSKKQGLIPNNAQVELVKNLESLIKDSKPSLLSSLGNIFSNKKPKGFYLYGDIGSGKTMIINLFLDQFENLKVYKVHFNKFMVDVHNRLHKKKNESEVLPNIVKNLKTEYDIIFLDEFQVTNIADAMILGKLFEQFYSKNIFIITTSNVRPDNLYLGGLQRGQFLRYIEMIKQNSIIYSLDTGVDYRQLFLKKKNKFFPHTNPQAKKMFNDVLLGTLNGKKFSPTTLIVKGRKVVVKNFVSNIAKFDFKDLFFENYSAEDYIEMSKIIKIFFIENIPNFNEDLINEQYRFINFIDVIYDNKLKLVATAATQINNLTSSSKVQKVFSRTQSRLKELTAVR